MATFPTLSKSPNTKGFSQTLAFNPSVINRFSSGHVLTRAKYTNGLKLWNFQYSFLTSDDKTLLIDFEKDRKYSVSSFDWENPEDKNIYDVRFTKLLKFIQNRFEGLWNVKIELIERIPNSEIDPS